MPIHDWTKVDAGIFHHFHGAWIVELARTLNAGGLPPDYYALTEQHPGPGLPDVLALHSPLSPVGNGAPPTGSEAGQVAGSGPRPRPSD